MTDRDHFAAAALTGLLANEGDGPALSKTCEYAYRIADAMLRERERTSVGVAGMDPATDRKSAATHGACASPCSQPFDSAPITHDAAPAAKAAPSESSVPLGKGHGTGDTPVTEPLLQRKRAEVSAEPAAWYVRDRAAGQPMLFWDEERAKKAAFACGVGARPLCLCQDLSQKNLTLTDAQREALRFCVTASLPETEKLGGVAGELCRMHAATLRGLLDRMVRTQNAQDQRLANKGGGNHER